MLPCWGTSVLQSVKYEAKFSVLQLPDGTVYNNTAKNFAIFIDGTVYNNTAKIFYRASSENLV